MKNIKRIVAALLAMMMVVALASTAFAYSEEDIFVLVQFKGSAWGYDHVTNQYGRGRSDVAIRKGSTLYAVAKKGNWYKLALPERGTPDYGFLWFNGDYLKIDVEGEERIVYSSGGSGRSFPGDITDTIAAKYKKVAIAKAGRRSNIRKTASLKGKSLGVLRYGKTLKLHPDHIRQMDTRGVWFYKVLYNGKPAWISAEYTRLKK
ncbi:MAG: SH3 domain-containing protein [Clostridia bacterium]|nr:SH3 domain-containing protein [Clostridia bacterium]